MNYVWEALLAADAGGIDRRELRFMPAEIPSPYAEVSFTHLNTTELESPWVEVNPLYRFGDVFAELFAPDIRKYGEAPRKGYVLCCVDVRTSGELYRLYKGGLSMMPEHLRIWKIPLIDFQVKEPVSLSLPMAIDFGSVNTTAGVYLDAAYMEHIGRTGGILKLKPNTVNYTLFDGEEKDSMQKAFYGYVGNLQVTVGIPPKDIQKAVMGRQHTGVPEGRTGRIHLDKWKLSFREKDGLVTRKEIPDVTFNIFQIQLLLEGEVYGIVRKFMEEMYENGRLGSFSFLKLTGQSCKIDLFKDALKEFVPGKMIQFRKKANMENADYELKMTCVDGVLKYLRDKRQGIVDVKVDVGDAVIPYQVTAFSHDGREVVLLDGTKDWKQAGCISRNLEELTLQMYLKDGNGEERYRFRYLCCPKEFTVQTNEEIRRIYGSYIRQEETDTITVLKMTTG